MSIPAQEIKASKPQPKQPTVSVTRSGLVRFQDEKTKLYGFKDKQTGLIALPAKWTWAMEFSEGLAAVEERGSRNGFINQKGERVLFCDQNCSFSEFHEGLAAVYVREHKYGRSDNHYGFIDKTGRFVIEPMFEYTGTFNEGFCNIRRINKRGFIDKTGGFFIDPIFEDALSFSGGLCAVKYSGKWGFIDKTGGFVVQPLFEYAKPFSEGLCAVEYGGKWGFIDKTGRFVIEPRFETAEGFVEGLSAVEI